MGLIDDLNTKPVLHVARGLGLRVAGATSLYADELPLPK